MNGIYQGDIDWFLKDFYKISCWYDGSLPGYNPDPLATTAPRKHSVDFWGMKPPCLGEETWMISLDAGKHPGL